MKHIIFLFLGSLCFLDTNAQEPAIEWQKCFGGSDYDWAYSVDLTSDGGFVVAGFAYSHNGDVTGNHGESDFWVVKLDGAGNLMWQKTLGGSHYDEASSIRQTPDGGYIVAGYSHSTDGDVTGNHANDKGYATDDLWLVKLNESGNLVWEKSLGGWGTDKAYSLELTNDGGYIVVGYSNSYRGDVTGNNFVIGYWVVKLDDAGKIMWERTLDGGWNFYHDRCSIQQTSDGGYILAGYTYGNDFGYHGWADFLIVKLFHDGLIDWQRSLGGSKDERAYAVKQTSDGGYILTGFTNSTDIQVSGSFGGGDAWVVRLDGEGNFVWKKCFGGSEEDWAYTVDLTSDGGFIVAGASRSSDGQVFANYGLHDCWVFKLDSGGEMLWSKSLGGNGEDEANSIKQTPDGGFIVAGLTNSTNGDVSGKHGADDFWIVKLSCTDSTDFYADADSDGYGNPDSILHVAGCIPPAGYVFYNTDCNDTNSAIHPGAEEIWNEIDDNCNGWIDDVVGVHDPKASSPAITLFPNPASRMVSLQWHLPEKSPVSVTIAIANILGEVLLEKTSCSINGELSETISLNNNFSPGIYFVRVSSDQQQWTAPLVVEK